jgi:hypothetical protein
MVGAGEGGDVLVRIPGHSSSAAFSYSFYRVGEKEKMVVREIREA